MKKALTLLFASFAVLSLSSCNVGSKESADEDLFIITPEQDEEFATGTQGGFLIEIATDQWLIENTDYVCTYSPNISNKKLRIVTSHTKYATITYDEKTPNTFTINTHKPGDSWLKIYDAEDTLVYRHVIHVRREISASDMAKNVFDHEKWYSTGIFGKYTLESTSINPFTLTVQGSDDFDSNSQMTFTVENEPSEVDDYYYYYKVEESQVTGTDKKITDMMISKTGERMYVYYGTSDISLLEMFSYLESIKVGWRNNN